ncbi:hypothetical protein CLAFUW4_08153 [Fulvia fulva]|uniref:DUF6604 domain-containing protein n=1 Tax=Passalora fulva TaxID=5499 RepID=A0A9Q8LDS6_PASFU|nr:uncharacterized protein CLAFUR5_08267 [Fulvia fulva]KAK4629419.1 hypothetical protein CLAFUR4_08158 [Fulvia fulva]KAK4630236.1 hypothetical protein CLAFUR0_08153 [Fulvia fulva]UJO15537.1 hypothetical protein CLAFUR5_08267 [Fulvia fulva]WPV12642.1 hypothetical protein CLAFUW4_08153 [Fulvia fulva]WPV27381.1 hypothetical protein CLAFUW7_08153 [Fulvia fulva]
MTTHTAPPLASRHAQYTAGTKKTTEWLCLTAHTLTGAAIDLTEATQISVQKHLSLAQTIATAAKLAMQVEVEGLSQTPSLLDGVIESRQEFVKFYSAHYARSQRQSSHGHRHCLGALRNVRMVLLTVQLPETGSADREDTSGLPTANVYCIQWHRWEEDEDENNDDEALWATSHTALETDQTQSGHAPFTHQERPPEELLDREFAVWCFVRDAQDLKRWARDALQEYSSGHISFTAASEVLTTAVNLIREHASQQLGPDDWTIVHEFLEL